VRLHYVTSNEKKFREAELILHREPHTLPHLEFIHAHIDLDELQGMPEDIITHKTNRAFEEVQAPVIVDDISFGLNALKGLPGPYIKTFLYTIYPEGLWELASHYEDRRCSASCYIGLRLPHEDQCHVFSGHIEGTVVEPRGSQHCGRISWNNIIVPDGSTRTAAEMTLDEFSQISPRNKALSQLKEFLHNMESQN